MSLNQDIMLLAFMSPETHDFARNMKEFLKSTNVLVKSFQNQNFINSKFFKPFKSIFQIIKFCNLERIKF